MLVSGTMRGALVAFIVLLGGAPMAANWPQWRGPSGHGVSAESDLPTTWSQSENVAWSAALAGLGSSSPIVWRDQVFVTSQIGRLPLTAARTRCWRVMMPRWSRARDRLAAAARSHPTPPPPSCSSSNPSIDRTAAASGSTASRREVRFPTLHEKHNLATPTPVTDGEHVFAWFGTGQLVALDMRGGVVWSKHLGEEYSPFDINWGHGSSPVLYRGLADPALRSRVGVVPGRARRAHGQAAVEGRPRQGACLVQHAAGRPQPRAATSSSSTRASASTGTIRPRAPCCGLRTPRVRRRSRRRCFTTASST